jgi:superfamily II DNA or RNA helicase
MDIIVVSDSKIHKNKNQNKIINNINITKIHRKIHKRSTRRIHRRTHKRSIRRSTRRIHRKTHKRSTRRIHRKTHKRSTRRIRRRTHKRSTRRIRRRTQKKSSFLSTVTNYVSDMISKIPLKNIPVPFNPYIYDEYDYEDSTDSKNFDFDCILNSNIKLKGYQIKPIKFILENKALLVCHATGLGKTLTAYTASKCYLDKYPDRKVIVVSPASLLNNFHKESLKYGTQDLQNDSRYKFYSFNKFHNLCKSGSNCINCKKTLLIVDEVHNIKSMGAMFKNILKCALQADKVLLLSATPFINHINDFKPILKLLYQKNDEFRFPKDPQKALDTLRTYLKGRISFIDDKDNPDFPSVVHKYEYIDMDKEYYKTIVLALTKYHIFGDNPEVFYHGFRRVVNDIGASDYFNKKIEKVASITKSKKQTLVFTNWLESGISIITNKLKQEGISFDVISGSTKKELRMKIVEDFNNKKFQVLCITKAGSEGLDLKGTRNIIILDPTWNPSSIEQVIGRGVRYKSHENEPEKNRNVTVYYLIYKSPKNHVDIETKILGHPLPFEGSGDVILYKIIERKLALLQKINGILKSISI